MNMVGCTVARRRRGVFRSRPDGHEDPLRLLRPFVPDRKTQRKLPALPRPRRPGPVMLMRGGFLGGGIPVCCFWRRIPTCRTTTVRQGKYARMRELGGTSTRSSQHRTFLITSAVAAPTGALAHFGHLSYSVYAAIVMSFGILLYILDRYVCRLVRSDRRAAGARTRPPNGRLRDPLLVVGQHGNCGSRRPCNY